MSRFKYNQGQYVITRYNTSLKQSIKTKLSTGRRSPERETQQVRQQAEAGLDWRLLRHLRHADGYARARLPSLLPGTPGHRQHLGVLPVLRGVRVHGHEDRVRRQASRTRSSQARRVLAGPGHGG